MPFKSQAQRRKFAQLLVEGKISNETFEEWNRETGGKKLPERVRTSKASKKVGGRHPPPAAKKREPCRRKNLSWTDASVGAVDYYGHPAAPAVASYMQRFRRPLPVRTDAHRLLFR